MRESPHIKSPTQAENHMHTYVYADENTQLPVIIMSPDPAGFTSALGHRHSTCYQLLSTITLDDLIVKLSAAFEKRKGMITEGQGK